MKYYSEEIVKKIIKDAMDYAMTISSSVPLDISNYPSIEIKEPHGRCIEADPLMTRFNSKQYEAEMNGSHAKAKAYSASSFFVCFAPTILEASK